MAHINPMIGLGPDRSVQNRENSSVGQTEPGSPKSPVPFKVCQIASQWRTKGTFEHILGSRFSDLKLSKLVKFLIIILYTWAKTTYFRFIIKWIIKELKF